MTRSRGDDLGALLERVSDAVAALQPTVAWPELADATDLPLVLEGAAALVMSLQYAAARLTVYVDAHAAQSALDGITAPERDPALQAAAAELGQASALSRQLADVLSAAAGAVGAAVPSSQVEPRPAP